MDSRGKALQIMFGVAAAQMKGLGRNWKIGLKGFARYLVCSSSFEPAWNIVVHLRVLGLVCSAQPRSCGLNASYAEEMGM